MSDLLRKIASARSLASAPPRTNTTTVVRPLVVVQSDPFVALRAERAAAGPDAAADLVLFAEHFPFKKIGNCPFNGGWVRGCWGKGVYEKVSEQVVLCSGSYMGTRRAIAAFESTLLHEARAGKQAARGSRRRYVSLHDTCTARRSAAAPRPPALPRLGRAREGAPLSGAKNHHTGARAVPRAAPRLRRALTRVPSDDNARGARVDQEKEGIPSLVTATSGGVRDERRCHAGRGA